MSNREVEGQGIFIEELRKELEKRNVHTEWIGIKAADTEKTLLSIQDLLSRRRNSRIPGANPRQRR
jgi:hypothetical protein